MKLELKTISSPVTSVAGVKTTASITCPATLFLSFFSGTEAERNDEEDVRDKMRHEDRNEPPQVPTFWQQAKDAEGEV